MHTWVVVAARRGRGLPRGIEEHVARSADGELPFVADATTTWWSNDRSLGFAGWSSGSAHLGIGSYWDVDADGLTAFNGHLWFDAEPWTVGPTRASQLAAALQRRSVSEVAEGLSGIGALVSLRHDGSGAITADPLGMGLLYRAETEDVVVVSNRASVAARVITAPGRRPERDVNGTGFVAHASNPQLDVTTFVGVRVVPQASIVEFAPGAEPSVVTWSDKPWWDPRLFGDPEAAVESAIDHLRKQVRLTTTLPAWIRQFEITGGRDSRAVFALILAEGLEHAFSYLTWGTPELVDVQVASALADRYGLELKASGRPEPDGQPMGARPLPAGIGPIIEQVEGAQADANRRTGPSPAHPMLEYEARIRHQVWASSGALSVWDLRPGPEPSSRKFSVTGLTGELLRTSYPQSRGLTTEEDLAAYVEHRGFSQNPQGLLTADATEHYQSLTRQQAFDSLPEGGVATDAIDGMFVRTGYRRWFGLRMELDPRNRLAPLYSLPAVRAAFAIGPERRHAQELLFRVVRSGGDELAQMRLAQRGWPVDVVAGLDQPERYPTDPMPRPWQPPTRSKLKRRRKVPTKRLEGNSRDQERGTDQAAKVAILRRYLDLPSGHAVWDVLDRRRTLAALDRLDEVSKLERRQVYDAVTVAMWLDGAEERAASLEVEVPSPT